MCCSEVVVLKSSSLLSPHHHIQTPNPAEPCHSSSNPLFNLHPCRHSNLRTMVVFITSCTTSYFQALQIQQSHVIAHQSLSSIFILVATATCTPWWYYHTMHCSETTLFLLGSQSFVYHLVVLFVAASLKGEGRGHE